MNVEGQAVKENMARTPTIVWLREALEIAYRKWDSLPISG
jgi:hypothetical protein